MQYECRAANCSTLQDRRCRMIFAETSSGTRLDEVSTGMGGAADFKVGGTKQDSRAE